MFIGKKTTLVLNKPEIVIFHQSNNSRQKKVPEKDQRKVISKHHDRLLLRHSKRNKIIKLIQKNYQFLNIRKVVEEYIKQYTTSAQNKSTRHKPYGKQQQIKVSQQA